MTGERAPLDDEYLRRLSESPGGGAPSQRALKEGWLLWSSPREAKGCYKFLARFSYGNSKVYLRLTADVLALYADVPGSGSGKGARPFEVMFLASVSAVLGREKGSDHLRVVHARSDTWQLRLCAEDDSEENSLQEWGKCIQSRLSHFRAAKRQSQRITVSMMCRVNGKLKDTHKWVSRKTERRVKQFFGQCAPCLEDGLTQFGLNRRLGETLQKEVLPYKGKLEYNSDLVNEVRFKELSDPEVNEAQSVHWSEVSVKFLRICYTVPQELLLDFTLTLRMGAPDGLKRLIWPLAAGEAVEQPLLPGGSSSSRAAGTTWRDPDSVYKSATGRAFGGVDPKTIQLRDPVPTFCQGIAGMEEAPPLKSMVKHLDVLNEEGLRALRRLLWAIQLTSHQVEFCPFLPNLMCTLLCFFTEAETMSMVTCLLKKATVDVCKSANAEPAIADITQRMILTSKELNKLAKMFVREGMSKPMTETALKHLQTLGFDLHALASELLVDGLAGRLPFRAFTRLCGSFLREGSQVILRYGLALIQLNSDALAACTTKEDARKVLNSLGDGFAKYDAIEQLAKAAFSRIIEDNEVARVNSTWGSDYVAPKSGDYMRHLFCRPRLFEPKGLAPDAAWETLWGWVPAASRIFDPHLVYTPTQNGTSLRTLLEVCKKHAESPMVFFCYSNDGHLLGGYSPGIWVRTNGYIKTSLLRRPAEDAFVFRKLLDKELEVWQWTSRNEMLFDASEVHGLMFGGQLAAISISQDLLRCTTSPSVSFGSPMLVAPSDNIVGGTETQGNGEVVQTLQKGGPRRKSGSIELCGKESADFEMLAFEVFALL